MAETRGLPLALRTPEEPVLLALVAQYGLPTEPPPPAGEELVRLTGPAAAASYGGTGYPAIEPLPASRQGSKFYPLLTNNQS